MSFKTTVKDRGAKTIKKVASQTQNKGAAYVAVGILGSAGQHEDSKLTVAQVATYHEFGTDKVPERSFLRSTFRENKNEYSSLTKRLYSDVIFGRTTARQALGLLGLKFVADVKNKIRAGISPANSPSTIARKGSTLPLVDTGQMINSIRHEVRDK